MSSEEVTVVSNDETVISESTDVQEASPEVQNESNKRKAPTDDEESSDDGSSLSCDPPADTDFDSLRSYTLPVDSSFEMKKCLIGSHPVLREYFPLMTEFYLTGDNTEASPLILWTNQEVGNEVSDYIKANLFDSTAEQKNGFIAFGMAEFNKRNQPVRYHHQQDDVLVNLETNTFMPSNETNSGNSSSNIVEQNGSFVGTASVPNLKVGLVIGKFGDTIAMLNDFTGATVMFEKNDNDNSDPSGERLCTITADSSEKVQRCIREIHRLCENANGVTNYVNEVDEHQMIVVPTKVVGALIGKSGETIRMIQMKAACTVRIEKDNEALDNEYERRIHLYGTEEVRKAAIELIDRFVAASKSEEIIDPFKLLTGKLRVKTLNMTVLNGLVGLVIGKKGEFIRNITKETGVRVQIDKESFNGTHRNVILSGKTDRDCHEAKKMIDANIAKASQNHDQPQYGGYNNQFPQPQYNRHGGYHGGPGGPDGPGGPGGPPSYHQYPTQQYPQSYYPQTVVPYNAGYQQHQYNAYHTSVPHAAPVSHAAPHSVSHAPTHTNHLRTREQYIESYMTGYGLTRAEAETHTDSYLASLPK